MKQKHRLNQTVEMRTTEPWFSDRVAVAQHFLHDFAPSFHSIRDDKKQTRTVAWIAPSSLEGPTGGMSYDSGTVDGYVDSNDLLVGKLESRHMNGYEWWLTSVTFYRNAKWMKQNYPHLWD